MAKRNTGDQRLLACFFSFASNAKNHKSWFTKGFPDRERTISAAAATATAVISFLILSAYHLLSLWVCVCECVALMELRHSICKELSAYINQLPQHTIFTSIHVYVSWMAAKQRIAWMWYTSVFLRISCAPLPLVSTHSHTHCVCVCVFA